MVGRNNLSNRNGQGVDSMIEFKLIPADQITYHWAKAREMLVPSFDRYKVQFHGVDDYLDGLLDGTVQLWAACEQDNIVGVAVTSIDCGSQSKICSILSLGGTDLHWISGMDAVIEQFANDNNCDALQYVGRRGFSKLIPTWKEDGIVFIKQLGVKHG